MNVIFVLFGAIPLIFGTPKVIYSYDNQGNRVERKVVAELQKKDETLEHTLVSDSTILTKNEGGFLNTNASEIKLGSHPMRVYPNPTKGIVSVEMLEELENLQIAIFDSKGQAISNIQKTGLMYSIDLSNYPAGYYYLDIKAQGKLGTYSIIKE